MIKAHSCYFSTMHNKCHSRTLTCKPNKKIIIVKSKAGPHEKVNQTRETRSKCERLALSDVDRV